MPDGDWFEKYANHPTNLPFTGLVKPSGFINHANSNTQWRPSELMCVSIKQGTENRKHGNIFCNHAIYKEICASGIVHVEDLDQLSLIDPPSTAQEQDEGEVNKLMEYQLLPM